MNLGLSSAANEIELSRNRFMLTIQQGVRDPALVNAAVETAEAAFTHFDLVIREYLELYRSPRVPEKLTPCYVETSRSMVLYGLYTHFICFCSDHRPEFARIGEQCLYDRWSEMALKAISILNGYNRDNQGLPELFFRRLFVLESYPYLKVLKPWFWSRTRLEGAVRDRFATGVVLGMVIDMETAKLAQQDQAQSLMRALGGGF